MISDEFEFILCDKVEQNRHLGQYKFMVKDVKTQVIFGKLLLVGKDRR